MAERLTNYTKLFYSETDKKVFLICGYDDSDMNMKSKISRLESLYGYFKRSTKVKTNVLNILVVENSSRYKGMNVVFCDLDETETIPTYAYRLEAKSGWTMMKWLEN